MNLKKVLLTLIIATISLNVLSNETTLIVSIDKVGVVSSKIQEAVDQLNYVDVNTGTCYVESSVNEYIDYETYDSSGTYYGVALVNFKWNCDSYARNFLTAWNSDSKYTIWSNSRIGPFPAVTGSN